MADIDPNDTLLETQEGHVVTLSINRPPNNHINRDLIVRIASEEDKRQVRIYLTDQIRPTAAALQQKRDEVVARMTRAMSPADLAELHRLLDQARANLEHPETNQQTGE